VHALSHCRLPKLRALSLKDAYWTWQQLIAELSLVHLEKLEQFQFYTSIRGDYNLFLLAGEVLLAIAKFAVGRSFCF
jgi:hypothetical protein